jgi:phosphopantothenoylcysteine decarboxylase/phosphopantothenate--cysteine ligase
MLEPEELVQRVQELFRSGVLAGCQVLVTAGPTREPLDPVRYLSNRSSGKMGFAVAAAAAEAGARVTLVSGPVNLPTPAGVERIDVETAAQMHEAVMQRAGAADICIAAAAVADYRPARVSPDKLKKSAAHLQLELERNPDIVAEVAALQNGPFTVGFAAETGATADHARGKLQAKSLAMIAANTVGPGLGFDTEDNELQVFWDGGSRHLPRTRKTQLARELVALIAERYRATNNSNKVISLHAQDSAQGS